MKRLVMALAMALVCIADIGCDSGSASPARIEQTDAFGRTLPALLSNDPNILVNRCGKPDEILDTSFDDPRPPIPSRILTYRRAHLRIAYVSADPIGQPPPYHWKLIGIVDTRTNRAVHSNDFVSTFKRQLPCMLANPKAVIR
jgi:hypothetical protein